MEFIESSGKSEFMFFIAALLTFLFAQVGDLLNDRYKGKMPDASQRGVTKDDRLETVMARLSGRDVYRLFVLSPDFRIIGKITLSKFMRFFLSIP